MDSRYFNYTTHFAERGWERRAFIKQWQRIYAGDPRWVTLHRRQRQILLNPQHDPYLSAVVAAYVRLEALPHRKHAVGMGGAVWEESVAAAVLCVDSTTTGKVGRLALLHCANDEETVDRIIGVAQEELWQLGCRQMIGPTALSPHMPSGLLMNYFHVTPPLHTPYNPPYFPELLATNLSPQQHTVLFHFALEAYGKDGTKSTSELAVANTGAIKPVAASYGTDDDQKETRLESELTLLPLSSSLVHSEHFLALWDVALPTTPTASPPNQQEIAFLWKWLTVWPWLGWAAMVEDNPIGFVLLQPDFAEQSRIAKGGENPLWALWLQWRRRYGVTKGHIICGGVLPEWRGQGIGRALWEQAVTYAQQQRWQSITIGPVLAKGAGAAFLEKQGAQRQQEYTLYASEM